MRVSGPTAFGFSAVSQLHSAFEWPSVCSMEALFKDVFGLGGVSFGVLWGFLEVLLFDIFFDITSLLLIISATHQFPLIITIHG